MSVYEITSLVIEKGTYFETKFNLFEPDNTEAILNGLTTSYAKIRKHSASLKYQEFEKNIDEQNGTITLSLTEEQTSSLDSGRNFFDVVLVIDNKPIKVIKGTALVEESMSV